jgi:hypothetical protein
MGETQLKSQNYREAVLVQSRLSRVLELFWLLSRPRPAILHFLTDPPPHRAIAGPADMTAARLSTQVSTAGTPSK